MTLLRKYPYDHRTRGKKTTAAIKAMIEHVRSLPSKHDESVETYAEYLKKKYAGKKQLVIKTMEKP